MASLSSWSRITRPLSTRSEVLLRSAVPHACSRVAMFSRVYAALHVPTSKCDPSPYVGLGRILILIVSHCCLPPAITNLSAVRTHLVTEGRHHRERVDGIFSPEGVHARLGYHRERQIPQARGCHVPVSREDVRVGVSNAYRRKSVSGVRGPFRPVLHTRTSMRIACTAPTRLPRTVHEGAAAAADADGRAPWFVLFVCTGTLSAGRAHGLGFIQERDT